MSMIRVFADWYYTQHGTPVTTIASQLSSQERLYRMVSEMAVTVFIFSFSFKHKELDFCK